MSTLTEVTSPRVVDDAFALDVDGDWRQGRGAFGGLVIGALVRAVEARIADPARKVRSVTAEIPAAVEAGLANIGVSILRKGNSIAVARAELTQGPAAEVRAHAVVTLAADRKGAGPLAWQELTPPEAPSWRTIEPLAMTPGLTPDFARHFEYRLVTGAPLMGGAAAIVGWVRPREPGPLRDAGYLAAMIDAWWPAALIRFPAMRPIATITYTLELVGGVAGLDPDAPLLYRATVPVCADGYFLETRELWGEDGRLVAINHQTFAIIA